MSAVQLERRGGTLVATLDRAPVNAIDDELLARLDAALVEAERDESIAVLHLRSAHKVFCAGADLALIRASVATPQGLERMLATVQAMQRVFARLEQLPCLTLAELGGATLGGGFELALACDLRIVSESARIGLPEARLGLLPAAGGTQRMTRICGEAVARRLILGAELVGGAEAVSLGLAQWSAPAGETQPAARAIAARIAELPPQTLAANKRCIDIAAQGGADGYETELSGSAMLLAQEETQRRVTRFLEKR